MVSVFRKLRPFVFGRKSRIAASAARACWVVADSIVPGAVVTQVARRHGCRPQQVHDWRALARAGKLTLPAGLDPPLLVPLLSEPPVTPTPATITIDIAGASVRISGRPGVAELIDVFTALQKARSC